MFRGGEGARHASREMRRKTFSRVCALYASCVLAFGIGAASARAQDAPGVISITMRGGETEKGNACCTYLGVFMEELTAAMKEKADYPRTTGVVIARVAPGGPAEKAGIGGGDICYLFDGVKVEDSAHLAKLVKARKEGEKVAIVIYREGKEKKLFVKLEHRDLLPSVKDELGSYSVEDLSKIIADASKSAGNLHMQIATRGHLGMALADLNEDLAPYFSVRKGEGVLVLSVETDSPAAKAGIKGGDVIVSVNGVAVGAVGDISGELTGIEKGDMVSLDVLRKGVKKSYELEAGAGSDMSRIFVAPFEQSGIKIKRSPGTPAWVEADKSAQEALKLKEEMKALKERLKDLEERLGEVERKE